MKYLKIISLFLCLFVVETFAQQGKSTDLSHALHIGDSFVPPEQVQVMRGVFKKVDWKSLDNKVIVLDFFDTFCTACIKAMPKLQKLQENLGDKLQVFTVTWQDKPTIEKFFSTNEYLKSNKVNLPVIYSDTDLKSLFPHAGIPHLAIIFKGKVKAITMSEFVTETNISNLYDTSNIIIPLKDDFGVGNLTGQLQMGGLALKAGVLISGYQNGVPAFKNSLTFGKDSISGKFKSSFYNLPILFALRGTWSKLKTPTYVPRPERVLLKVRDSLLYSDLNNEGEVWMEKYGICYERYDLVKRSDSVQAAIVLNDLHNYFGIKSYFDMKEMDCLVFKSCPVVPYNGPEIKGAFNYENSSVLASFIDLSYMFPPTVDLVKSTSNMKIGGYENLVGLNQQLRAYGIEAKIEKAKIEVFVVEEIE